MSGLVLPNENIFTDEDFYASDQAMKSDAQVAGAVDDGSTDTGMHTDTEPDGSADPGPVSIGSTGTNPVHSSSGDPVPVPTDRSGTGPVPIGSNYRSGPTHFIVPVGST